MSYSILFLIKVKCSDGMSPSYPQPFPKERENSCYNLLMARQKVNIENNNNTLMGALSIFMFILGTLLLMGSMHRAGIGGNFIFNGLRQSIGVLAYTLPIISYASAYYLWREKLPSINIKTVASSAVLAVSALGLIHIIYGSGHSGVLGYIIANPLVELFDKAFSVLILSGVLISTLMLLTDHKPRISALHEHLHENMPFKDFRDRFSIFNLLPNFSFFNFLKRDSKESDKYTDQEGKYTSGADEESDYENIDYESEITHTTRGVRDELFEGFEEEHAEGENYDDDYASDDLREKVLGDKSNKKNKNAAVNSKAGNMVTISREILEAVYTIPPLDILNVDSGKSSAGNTNRKMQLMKQTLLNFNIPVEMDGVSVGPTVTRYRVKPAQGVKVNKILTLKDDLQLSLEASSIHIEAPIPGQPFVGIEIPNENKQTLGLGSMLSLPQFETGGQLMLAIGKDIVGKPIFGDLIKMPHLLVAGATRTGKSITIQNLLISLLYKNSPHDLKLIILDPKRVEFTAYKGLPHLYAPIVVDPKGAIKALNWLVQEMERRYEILAEFGVPNLEDYNNKIFYPEIKAALKKQKGDDIENVPPKLPWIVTVFDEFNDFMLSHSKEITPLITSLTQKGRAAGVHLILATQRPDVKVITGTIKANIPARIALKTTSGMDSRTILDMGGAEDLLGNGDMLYMDPLSSRIARIQAPFVSTEEIQAVIKYIKSAEHDFIPDHIDLSKVNVSNSGNESVGEYTNPLDNNSAEPIDNNDYMSAKDYVIATGKASASSLQTAFSWGFPKANKMMMLLERHGVVGPSQNGARGREVLIKPNDINRGEL